MRTTVEVICVVILLILSVNISFAVKDYLYIVRFDKGEMFTDFDPQKVEVSLSKEYVKDGKISLKINYKDKAFVGEWKPMRAFWTGYSKINFFIYNDSNEERELIFRIKGARQPSKSPENTFETTLKLLPGYNEYSIDLTKAICNDGKSLLDLNGVYVYSFENKVEKPLTIYLSGFKLVK